MGDSLFNGFTLSNEEIEKILNDFDKEIKCAIIKMCGSANQDYEQITRLQIFRTLSRNRKK